MLFFDLGRVENNLNGGHLWCISGLACTSKSDNDTDIDQVLLIAAWATSDQLELSMNLLWLTQLGDIREEHMHPMFFSDVSCMSHSRCTLNSSWSLVACATMSKTWSISVSLSDLPVCARPEMHHRYPPFELFSTWPRSKNNIKHEPQNLMTHWLKII